MKRFAPCALMALLCGLAASPAQAFEESLNPKATFLLTNGDPLAAEAQAYSLDMLGIAPGQTILIERLGDFQSAAALPDTTTSLLAVFSKTLALLPDNRAHRVANAIDAGIDVVTLPTRNGARATDIAEDFLVSTGTVVTVPLDAGYLFFAAHDDFYGDNLDSNGNFGFRVSVVPEASTLAQLLAGLGAIGLLARRRQRAVSARATAHWSA